MEPSSDESSLNFNLKDIFSKNTLYGLMLLVIIYIVIYFVLFTFFHSWFDTKEHMVVMTIDIFIIAIGLLYTVYFFYQMTSEDLKHPFTFICRQLKEEFNRPISLVYMIMYLFFIYMSIFFFKIPKINGELPKSIHVLEMKSWYFFIILLVINILKFGFDIHIVDIIYNWIADTFNWLTGGLKIPKYGDDNDHDADDIEKEQMPIPQKEEVFNISDNKYSYEDAQAICKVYGGRMATYKEVENAYKDGGEWCNYGWSDGQMAIFPTQKSTWLELQKNDKMKNNCGRPGINGGYISTPSAKYGVNCIGIKPKISNSNKQYMKRAKSVIELSPASDTESNPWKNKQSKLVISAWNSNKWSEY